MPTSLTDKSSEAKKISHDHESAMDFLQAIGEKFMTFDKEHKSLFEKTKYDGTSVSWCTRTHHKVGALL